MTTYIFTEYNLSRDPRREPRRQVIVQVLSTLADTLDSWHRGFNELSLIEWSDGQPGGVLVNEHGAVMGAVEELDPTDDELGSGQGPELELVGLAGDLPEICIRG